MAGAATEATRKPHGNAADPKVAGAVGVDWAKVRVLFMVLLSYMPRRRMAGRAGIGTFRAVEGCQWVTEPVLSPLLYKSYENYLVANEGVPGWCCKGMRAFLICASSCENIFCPAGFSQ